MWKSAAGFWLTSMLVSQKPVKNLTSNSTKRSIFKSSSNAKICRMHDNWVLSVPAFVQPCRNVCYIMLPRWGNLITVNYDSDGSHAPTAVIKYNKGSVLAGTGGLYWKCSVNHKTKAFSKEIKCVWTKRIIFKSSSNVTSHFRFALELRYKSHVHEIPGLSIKVDRYVILRYGGDPIIRIAAVHKTSDRGDSKPYW